MAGDAEFTIPSVLFECRLQLQLIAIKSCLRCQNVLHYRTFAKIGQEVLTIIYLLEFP